MRGEGRAKMHVHADGHAPQLHNKETTNTAYVGLIDRFLGRERLFVLQATAAAPCAAPPLHTGANPDCTAPLPDLCPARRVLLPRSRSACVSTSMRMHAAMQCCVQCVVCYIVHGKRGGGGALRCMAVRMARA